MPAQPSVPVCFARVACALHCWRFQPPWLTPSAYHSFALHPRLPACSAFCMRMWYPSLVSCNSEAQHSGPAQSTRLLAEHQSALRLSHWPACPFVTRPTPPGTYILSRAQAGDYTSKPAAETQQVHPQVVRRRGGEVVGFETVMLKED